MTAPGCTVMPNKKITHFVIPFSSLTPLNAGLLKSAHKNKIVTNTEEKSVVFFPLKSPTSAE